MAELIIIIKLWLCEPFYVKLWYLEHPYSTKVCYWIKYGTESMAYVVNKNLERRQIDEKYYRYANSAGNIGC